VVSLLYPMVNCEDFDGWCMNNTGAWGHDLLNDPGRVAIAEATVPAKGVVTAGPLPLLQGGDTFIARLPINMLEGNHSMVVNGVEYPCWGFAVVLIDWARLKEESDIYKEFASKHMQFKLTRTDIIEDQPIVKTIAESSGSSVLANENVTLELDTGNNGWVITVGYDDGFSPHYGTWAYPLSICAALMFSILMMLVLVSKKQHEQILGRLLPQRAIKKMRKGEQVVERYKMVSIFFSDIVGYTKLSSEMTPEEVMKMLNDLYTKFDELADKHKVYKLETIGDAYIAIGGAPKVCRGPEAAERVALFALDAIEVAKNFRTDDGAQVYIRAGIASGPVVAGVVGSHLPKYTVFGDTVNFAARMEQTSKKMRLQISPSTQRMLLDAPNYNFEYEDRYDDNGDLGVELKGKGRQYTYWVNSAKRLERGSSETTPDTTQETSIKQQEPLGLLDESDEADEC
jgi:class 3 adenylate cyclase